MMQVDGVILLALEMEAMNDLGQSLRYHFNWCVCLGRLTELMGKGWGNELCGNMVVVFHVW